MLTHLIFFISAILMPEIMCELKYNSLKNKISWELLKIIPQKNAVSSALMLRFPLCKLAATATGEAKEELMAVLGYTNDTWMRGCYLRMREHLSKLSRSDLTYINKIYVNYVDNINPMFLNNSEYQFGVPVEKVGFNYPQTAVHFINRWINVAMYHRVKDILEFDDVNKNTTMLIVNAIHFKGTWEFPFDYKLTKLQNFHMHNGSVAKVPMMMKLDSLLYVDAGEFQAVSVRLRHTQATMTFVLPFNKHGLPDIVMKTYNNPDYLNTFLYRMKAETMALIIPRFQIKTFVDWTGFLQEMGLYSIFNCTSSGLSNVLAKDFRETNTVCLNKVKQKIFIEVDEIGVGRHGYDPEHDGPVQDMMAKDAYNLNAIQMVLDRPFYFTVDLEFSYYNRHELFTGVYYGPE